MCGPAARSPHQFRARPRRALLGSVCVRPRRRSILPLSLAPVFRVRSRGSSSLMLRSRPRRALTSPVTCAPFPSPTMIRSNFCIKDEHIPGVTDRLGDMFWGEGWSRCGPNTSLSFYLPVVVMSVLSCTPARVCLSSTAICPRMLACPPRLADRARVCVYRRATRGLVVSPARVSLRACIIVLPALRVRRPREFACPHCCDTRAFPPVLARVCLRPRTSAISTHLRPIFETQEQARQRAPPSTPARTNGKLTLVVAGRGGSATLAVSLLGKRGIRYVG